MKKLLAIVLSFFIFSIAQDDILATQNHEQYTLQQLSDLKKIAYAAADNLEHNIVEDIDKTLPIATATFVRNQDFNSTSALGKELSQIIGSRLSQHGYKIIDMRLRKDELVLNSDLGVLALSRNLHKIRDTLDAQAVVAGTYKCLEQEMLVTVKLIKTSDNSVISSHIFSFSIDKQFQDMCATETLQDSTQSENEKKENKNAQINQAPKMGPLASGTISLDPSKSTDAKLIQSRLADLGLYLDKIDGIWGKNSKIGLKKFKNMHQLPDPDKWDMRTQIKLFAPAGQ